MTIDKAIEILTMAVQISEDFARTEETEAIRLGIEALKCIAYWNQHQTPRHQFHLPGETKDDR